MKRADVADTWLDTIRISLTTNGRLDSKVVAARGKELQAQIDALVEFVYEPSRQQPSRKAKTRTYRSYRRDRRSRHRCSD